MVKNLPRQLLGEAGKNECMQQEVDVNMVMFSSRLAWLATGISCWLSMMSVKYWDLKLHSCWSEWTECDNSSVAEHQFLFSCRFVAGCANHCTTVGLLQGLWVYIGWAVFWDWESCEESLRAFPASFLWIWGWGRDASCPLHLPMFVLSGYWTDFVDQVIVGCPSATVGLLTLCYDSLTVVVFLEAVVHEMKPFKL